MAQLVEQRIRNAWVAGSSPASGSLSWYPLGTSFFLYYRTTREAQMEPLGTIWNYLERAKRKWNAAQRHTLTLKCVNFVNFVNFL